MDLSKDVSYPKRLFIGLLGYSLLLVGCFVVFQYQREKEFKIAELNSRLQLINSYVLNELKDGVPARDIRLRDFHPFEDIRLSVISEDGEIVYDNSLDSLPRSNHLDREEIRQALLGNGGFSVRRHSESTGDSYFYSATRGDNGQIVRTAVTYTVSLSTLLEADYDFLWVTGAISAIMCVIGYFATRRVGLDTVQRERMEKERLRKQLTNNINHELKTPVASIRICVETLLAHPELSVAQQQTFLQRTLTNTDRLQRLLNDVSLITRMDDGSSSIVREPLDLRRLILGIAEEHRLTAEAKGIEIRCSLPEEMPVNGNATLLEAIFNNLIDNAVAYSGGSLIRIETDGDEIIFSDNGSGVPAEHLPRLFERFYRIDKGRSRAAGGTGLGLSIVKNAVAHHNGTITAGNIPEGGLEFRIRIS